MRVGENFCPGILHAVPAKDGMLMRIRVPGGLIDSRQFRVVADVSDRFADGQIEITSRANLQLRAIKEGDLVAVGEALAGAGLLPSARHDRVRNIVTSPLAGLEPEELIDMRPFVRALDQRLIADDVFLELSPKFSFGIYGGGRSFTQEQDDLALRASRGLEGFQLYVGGRDTGYAVSSEHAVDCLLEAAKLCIAIAKLEGLAVRGKRIVAVPGGLEGLLEGLSWFLAPSSKVGFGSAVALAPMGVHQAARAGERNVVPAIPLGRLSSQQAKCIARMVEELEGDLRLAPWRGVVLGAVPFDGVADVAARLEAVGLSLDGRDGFHGIAACAGETGCDASLADVRGDAVLLARQLAGQHLLPGWTVNLSGCEKQCAMRHGATAELVGISSGYLLRINSKLVAESCASDAAIGLVLAAHENLISEVASA